MQSRLDQLLAADTARREAEARVKAAAALARLEEAGIEARLVGSLARKDFRLHSDIDLLILSCRPDQRYTIEGQVEEAVGGFPFHVIYLDETDARHRERLLREAVDASDLR